MAENLLDRFNGKMTYSEIATMYDETIKFAMIELNRCININDLGRTNKVTALITFCSTGLTALFIWDSHRRYNTGEVFLTRMEEQIQYVTGHIIELLILMC